MKTIDLIVGARPNFMKIAPIIAAIKLARSKGSDLNYRLIHTGQHYDRAMSDDFFTQLEIPEPDINLGVGSGTQAEQAANIMVGYEKVLNNSMSKLCLVVGDVTSTMACTIVARKAGIPVAHVEGGIRSGDWTMPEEINRVVTDSITNYFFTTSETANINLQKTGVEGKNIYFVGNTMIDTLLKQMNRLKPPTFWNNLNLMPGNYLVATLHRPANVDDEKNFLNMLRAIVSGAQGLPIIFPVHPRTLKSINKYIEQLHGLHVVEPQGYLEFNYLVKHAKGVITDSGGITEETTVMGIPCLTLRDNTERPETVSIGTNELVGSNPANIKLALTRLLDGDWKNGSIPEKWDGLTAIRIVSAIELIVHDRGNEFSQQDETVLTIS